MGWTCPTRWRTWCSVCACWPATWAGTTHGPPWRKPAPSTTPGRLTTASTLMGGPSGICLSSTGRRWQARTRAARSTPCRMARTRPRRCPRTRRWRSPVIRGRRPLSLPRRLLRWHSRTRWTALGRKVTASSPRPPGCGGGTAGGPSWKLMCSGPSSPLARTRIRWAGRSWRPLLGPRSPARSPCLTGGGVCWWTRLQRRVRRSSCRRLWMVAKRG